MDILVNIALIVIAVLLFCLIITVHELGHFSMAKTFGVRVNEFAIGMGPKLFKKQKGETLYSLRALPIGGFCAMEGEDEESDDPKAFDTKKVWQRVLIISMGAILNIVLGLVLMMILLCGQHSFNSTIVAQFADNAATHSSGIEIGDKITKFGGYRIYTDRDLTFAMATDKNVKEALKNNTPCLVNLKVKRSGQEMDLKNVRFDVVDNGSGGNAIKIDFKVQGIPNNFFTLMSKSFEYTVSTVRMVWASLIGLLAGQFGFNEMAGPVGLATALTQSASAGLQVNFGAAVANIVYIMVIITVNLGIFNLLPVPALDGGRLVFLAIEGIFRKPVPEKYEKWVHSIGFVLLMAIMVLITYSDVLRLITGKGLGG